MKDIKLKCGAPGCDYVTEEVSAEIALGLRQFHRQDYHAGMTEYHVGSNYRVFPGQCQKVFIYCLACKRSNGLKKVAPFF